MNLFSPKGFLQVGGLVLLLVGILGFIGVIGPTSDKSLFGSFWWFDNAENIAHLVLGIAGLVAAYAFPTMLQRYLVMLLGVVGVAVGLYNVVNTQLLGANLENPADLILHLVVGVWALYAVFGGKKAAAEPAKV